MKRNTNILWLVFGLVAIIGIGSLIAESGAKWTSSYDRTNGNSHWLVDSSGNMIPGKDDSYDLGTSTYEIQDIYIDGTATIDTLTVDGAATVASTLIVSDILTVTGTKGIDIGSVTSLPTSGYGPGSIVFYTGTDNTSNKFYGSTITVTNASCWVALH